MKEKIIKLLSFKSSIGNSVKESISITGPINIENVSNQSDSLNSETAICIVLDRRLQPLYISSPNKIIDWYYVYKKYFNIPQFQSLIETEDTWQSKASFIVIIECGCDAICNELKSTLLDELKPEYNQWGYLQQSYNCDFMSLKFCANLNNYPNSYLNYKVVQKNFPLWKLKVEIVHFFGNRTFLEPGIYHWVTTDSLCHLKTLHIKKGEIIHSKDTSTHQFNYFVNEQDSINLLNLIKQFLITH